MKTFFKRAALLAACAAYSLFFAAAVQAQEAKVTNEAAASRPAITEEMLRAEYDRFRAQAGDIEYLVAHILLSDRESAARIRDRLAQGESFAELARVYSRDPGSAKHGGKLDWASHAIYVAPFAEAIQQLMPGGPPSDPVRTQFGWHIIKVDATRPAKLPSFEEVKEQIRRHLEKKLAK